MKRALPKPAQKRPSPAPTGLKPKPKTVAQQSTDFTAEGAPPPGKVGVGEPVDSTQQALLKLEVARQAQTKRE